jgi:uncharacterized protein (TIGR02996 family)
MSTTPPPRRIPPDPLPIEPYFQNIPGSEAFLRAIAEEPLEDAHRLAFADWLEDAGHPARAAYIRIECADARLPDFHPAHGQLRTQLDKLFEQNHEQWLAGLPPGAMPSWKCVHHFRRGMLEHPHLFGHGLPEQHQLLFDSIDVRGLDLIIKGGEDLRRFLEMSWPSRLVSLQLVLAGEYHPDDLKAFGRSPALANLVELNVWAGHIGEDDVVPFVESLELPRLEKLALRYFPLGGAGIRALAGCAALTNLRELRLPYGCLELDDVRVLAASPLLANLTTLDLSRCGWQLTSQAIEALADSPFLAGLRSLELGGVAVGNKGAKALAKSPVLRQLSALGLCSTSLRTEGVRALARSANMRSLRVLDLSDNGKIGEAAVCALAKSANLSGLEALSLANNHPLSDKVAAALATSPALANLTALDLENTGISNEAARTLAASPHLKRLSFLNLRRNYLPRGAKNAIRKRWPLALLGKRK